MGVAHIFGTNINSEIEIKNISAESLSYSLKPRLIIEVRWIIHSPVPFFSGMSVYLLNPKLDIYFGPGEREDAWKIYIGTASPRHLVISIPTSATSISMTFYLDLDYWTIEKIEEIRAGNDLGIRVELSGVLVRRGSGANKDLKIEKFPTETVGIASKFIPKSLWVEKILSEWKFKFVRIVEIPSIPSEGELTEIATNLDRAWKEFLMGEYDNTVKYCRQALELTSTVVRAKGFEKVEYNQEGKARRVPDWEKFFDNEDIAEFIENFFRKLRRTTWIGAHPGKVVSREDANLILMNTYGFVYYVIRRLQKLEIVK